MENAKIDVLGTEYAIKIVKVSECDDLKNNKFCGLCNNLTHTILLGDASEEEFFGSMTEEEQEIQMKTTLRHEVIHAFLNESGLQDSAARIDAGWARNEEMVDWFAIQSPKIFKAFMKLGILGVHETQDEVIMYGADGKLDRVKTRQELSETIQCSTKNTVHCDSDKVINEISRAVNDKIKHDIRANGE